MASLLALMKSRRQELGEWLTVQQREHLLSLSAHELYANVHHFIELHARETCLDAGAGRSPYRRLLEQRGVKVTSLDWEQHGPLDLLGDVQDMAALPSDSFATVLLTQVLEHVARPWLAVAECARVLKPDGVLILSVPHLSIIHEAPNDYYRYTRYGIAALTNQAGLKLLDVRESGGLISFLLHPMSLAWLSAAGGGEVIREVAFQVNKILFIHGFKWADRIFGLRGLFPCNYVAAARKAR
jgi:SAM-dependent methyltransferase